MKHPGERNWRRAFKGVHTVGQMKAMHRSHGEILSAESRARDAFMDIHGRPPGRPTYLPNKNRKTGAVG